MSDYFDNNDTFDNDGQMEFDVPGQRLGSRESDFEDNADRTVTGLYNRLRRADQEYFKRAVRLLLSGTYILQMDYDTETGLLSRNGDYIFIESNYDLLYLYFEMGGFELVHDKDNGLFALQSESDFARFHFNLNTTRIALALRCIYQKKYSDPSTGDQITSDVGEVVQFLKDNVKVDITSNKQQMANDFKTFVSFHIIEKGKGEWRDPQTMFRITPAILHLVSAAKVSELLELKDEMEEQQAYME